MPTAAQPPLKAGRAYRTRELAAWGQNPTRLAKRLVREGQLGQLAPGLFYVPKRSRFGPVPPTDEEILRAFLGTEDFLITGPPRWNPLGLGATAVFPVTLVYNGKRSGEFELGGRRFLLRRVRYPRPAPAAWFVIDLLEHHQMAGVALPVLEDELRRALAMGRFGAGELREQAGEFGSRAIQALIERCAVVAAHG